MNCADFDRLWQRRFDGEREFVSPDEERHLAQCERCQLHYEAGLLLEESLAAWRVNRPRIELTRRIVAAVQSESAGPSEAEQNVSRRRNRVRRPCLRTGANEAVGPLRLRRQAQPLLAVLVALATVGGVWLFLGRSHHEGGDRSAVQIETTELAQVPPISPLGSRKPVESSPDSVPKPVGDAKDAYEPIARRAVGAFDDVAALVVPQWSRFAQASSAGAPPIDPAGGQASIGDSGLFRQLEREIRPIGRGVGEALDFLWIAGESRSNSLNSASP